MLVTVRKVPFKIVLRERRPIVIEVTVKNNTQREKKYVVSIETDNNLSLSPSGLARYSVKRTKTLYPGESEVVSFKVYPRATTREGEYDVVIAVDECVDSYDHVVATKELRVRVPVV